MPIFRISHGYPLQPEVARALLVTNVCDVISDLQPCGYNGREAGFTGHGFNRKPSNRARYNHREP